MADPRSRAAIVKDKPSLAIVLSLVLLVATALWQFHSLMWGDEQRVRIARAG